MRRAMRAGWARLCQTWCGRTQRERDMLRALAWGLLAVVLWRGFWLPLADWRTQARRALVVEQLRAGTLAAMEAERRRLLAMPPAAALDADRVEAELRRRAQGLQVDLASCGPGAAHGEIVCSASAAFDQWVNLLAALQAQPPLHAIQWSAEPAGEPGHVRLTMRLSGRPA